MKGDIMGKKREKYIISTEQYRTDHLDQEFCATRDSQLSREFCIHRHDCIEDDCPRICKNYEFDRFAKSLSTVEREHQEKEAKDIQDCDGDYEDSTD